MITPSQNPLLNTTPQQPDSNPVPPTPASEAPWAGVDPQPRPEEAAVPFTPVQVGGSPTAKANKPLHILLPTVAILVVAVGAIFAASTLSKGKETSVGSDYIKALQTKDYAAVEGLVSPEVSNLGDKVGQLGGDTAKTNFYKSYMNATAKDAGIGEGAVTKVAVTKATSDTDYAYATYQVGSKPVTVLETYDNGQPKVLQAKSGIKTYDASKFDHEYQSSKNQMNSMGTLLGEIAQGAGSNSKETIQSLFSTK
jgi:hypothetical protein